MRQHIFPVVCLNHKDPILDSRVVFKCLVTVWQVGTGVCTDHLAQTRIPHKVGSGIETSTRTQIGTRDNTGTGVLGARREKPLDNGQELQSAGVRLFRYHNGLVISPLSPDAFYSC